MGRVGVACLIGLLAATGVVAQTKKPEEVPTPVPAAALQAGFEPRPQARFSSPDLLEVPVDAETYVLGPQDVLAIMILIGEMRSEQLPVLPEGMVVIPNVGSVPAAGRTLAQFREDLRAVLAKRYRNFELYCHLARVRQFRVYVTGDVAEPGVVAARATERVADAIDRAGGLKETASQRQIELRDATGAVLAPVDLARFHLQGDLASNPHVFPGAVVFVPPRRQDVYVWGEVGDPGTYEVRSGESLAELLQLAGGLKHLADAHRVSVETITRDGEVRVRTVDVEREAAGTENVTRVTVVSSLIGKKRVFVMAPDGLERVLWLSEGETLRDLVTRIAQLQPEADITESELSFRGADGRRRTQRFDLTRVLAGDIDHTLQDSDVLSVPRVKNYIYLSGFVTRPGRYPYRADWTVNDYIGEAGGPTSGGSLDSAKLFAVDGSQRPANRTSIVQRGETIYMDRSFTNKASSAIGLFANVSALVISLIALSR